MKKIILGLLLVLVSVLILPSGVSAQKNKVTVYIFTQTTCPHCKEAKAFFKKLKQNGEYKNLFELRNLDIKAHSELSSLYDAVAEKMDDDASGVPYIIIGDKTFEGYGSSSDEAIKNAIKDTYNTEDYVSPIKDIVGDNGEVLYENLDSNWITPIIVLVVAGVIIGGTIYFARQNSEEEPVKETKIKEEPKEVKEEEVKVEKTEEKPKTTKKTTKKKGTSKKTTTTKKSK